MAEALEGAVPQAVDGLAQRILDEACRRRLKLATAESCTGGLLASLLTDIPGCSHAYERGFVVYTDDAKRELLGVPAAVLESPGAVSEEAARAMAEGALRHSRADLSLAVTGYAEAPPTNPKLAGMVHFGAARRGGPTLHMMERFGPVGRAEVRIRSVEAGLKLLWRALAGAT